MVESTIAITTDCKQVKFLLHFIQHGFYGIVFRSKLTLKYILYYS